MAREPVPCAVRAAVALQAGDVQTDLARPGVAVIDVVFPQAGAVGLVVSSQLQEIVFKNFYTAFLTIRVQRRSPADMAGEGPRKWVTCLRNYCLMPNPHTEEGSQDYFSVFRHQMLCDVDEVMAIRMILRQPSPVWLHFTIEELQIYPRGQESPQKDFQSWLSHLTSQEQPANLHGGLPNPEKVSAEVQQMWVLTEMIHANRAAARIGRFDVDGCYDVNLLSYT